MRIKNYIISIIIVLMLCMPMVVYAENENNEMIGGNENIAENNENNNNLVPDTNENSGENIVQEPTINNELGEGNGEGTNLENEGDSLQRGFMLGNSLETEGNIIYVSATGSDTTGDGSENNPYQTLSYASSQSSSGDTIMLLSDLEAASVTHVNHDLTIDGQGYTVTRQEGFETTSDPSRSWYNPAMIEVHPDYGGATLTLVGITLDDLFRHEGTVYADQNIAPADTSVNLQRVQDGIVSLYSDPENINKAILVLGDGATLQNFGGMSAVNIEGNSECIMKEGSLITNGGTGTNGIATAVWALSNGTLIMEKGSRITGISGSFAIFTNSGNAIINGEIDNCSGATPLRATGSSVIIIDKDGDVHDITGNTATIYMYGNDEVHVYGKIRNVSGVGIYPSCNGGTDKVFIYDPALITGAGQMAIQTNLQSQVYMLGGTISNNPRGVNVRKQSTFTMTGGTITENTYGLYLDKKSSNIAKIIVLGGEVSGNTTFDYYIETTETGYNNGSYLYLSPEMLENNPTVGMELNGKSITIPANNVEMCIGNASAASKTALNNEANRLGLDTKLTTWWFRNDQSNASFDVSGLTSNNEPLFALYVPVNAAGAPMGDVLCISATDGNPISVVLSTTIADAVGYSVLLAQANVPVYTITIEYEDKDDSSTIKTKETKEFVKDSNYDVTGLATQNIDGYYLYQAPTNLTGVASENLDLTSLYAKVTDIEVNALNDTVTYDGEYHSLSGFESLTFEIDGETYTISGIETIDVYEKNAGEYVLEVTGTPVVTDSTGEDVSIKFNILANNGLLTINKAKVIVTADDLSKIKGANDPALTAKITGLIGEDKINYNIFREQGEGVGKYAILFDGDTEQDNYLVTFVPGVFTIEEAPVEPTIIPTGTINKNIPYTVDLIYVYICLMLISGIILIGIPSIYLLNNRNKTIN